MLQDLILNANETSNLILNDPKFNKVKLLMHMDGEDGGIIFNDVKGNIIIPTNVVTKQNIKHSGLASAYFNHANAIIAVNNIDGNLIQNIGSQQFCIEATIFPSIINANGHVIIGAAENRMLAYEWAFYIDNWGIKLYAGRRGMNQAIIGIPYIFIPGNMYRVVVERDFTNTWCFYINNQPYAPTTVYGALGGNYNLIADAPMSIGCFWQGQGTFYGNLDEVRYTVGDYRYGGGAIIDNGLPYPDM